MSVRGCSVEPKLSCSNFSGATRQFCREAHNSTALEGNTLVLQEVETLLGDHKTAGDKPLAEYLEVKGYADTAAWVYEQALGKPDFEPDRVLTVTEVRRVRSLIESAERFVVPLLAQESDLVPLTSLESKELSQATLRRAVERGRLRAIKGDDGRLRSSQQWMGEYIASRWQRQAEPEVGGGMPSA